MNAHDESNPFHGTLHQGISQRSFLVLSQVDEWIMMNLVHAWTGYTVEQVAGQITWIAKERRAARRREDSPLHGSDEGDGMSEYYFPGPEEEPADMQPCAETSESSVQATRDFCPAFFSFESGEQLPAEQSIGSCPPPGILLAIHNSDFGPEWTRSMFLDNFIIESFRQADDFRAD